MERDDRTEPRAQERTFDKRKPYAAPLLERYGRVAELLSLGASMGAQSDGGGSTTI